MDLKIDFEPVGRRVICARGETILDAAQRGRDYAHLDLRRRWHLRALRYPAHVRPGFPSEHHRGEEAGE